MSKTKNIIILDVEGMGTVRPYNIGYIIADTKGNIIAEKSFALPSCIWENLKNCFCAKEMTHKNIEEILADEKREKYRYISVEDCKDEIIEDIKEYNVSEIWAYNVAFDKGALQRLFGNDFYKLEELCSFYDIWSAIIYTKLVNKKFVRYCKKNGFLTESGNCKTSAEVVYGYLFNQPNFVEEHTGLADVKIEYQTYLKAKQTKKKMLQKGNPWNMIKKFCENCKDI
jgi:hypothetical protein